MKFSLLFIAVFAELALATYGGWPGHGGGGGGGGHGGGGGGGHGGGGGPYCGTVTITEECRTATKTSYSYYPTVTQTVTKKKNLCSEFITKTATDVHTEKVIERTTITPTVTSTQTAPKVTSTSTKTVTVTGCPGQKRHFLEARFASAESEDDDEEDDEYEGLTNAERIRRGLPLAKPHQKRTGGYGPPRPSCRPSTTKIEQTRTITKSVTPTQYTTTFSCGFTQTFATTVWVTNTVTKTKTNTKTANASTAFETIIPTKKIVETATVTKPPAGGCK